MHRPYVDKKPRSFKHTCIIETGLYDFHRTTVTVMKATFQELQPRVVNYRDYEYKYKYLNEKKISDNKTFWKNIKHLFSDKNYIKSEN